MDQQREANIDDVHLLDYVKILRKRIKWIALFVFVVTSITIVYSLLVTKKYQADAVIVPVSGNSGKYSSLDKMGGLAALAGVNISGSSALTQFMVLFNSDTLSEEVVRKLDLVDVLIRRKNGADKNIANGDDRYLMDQAIDALKSSVSFIDNRKLETITISVILEDPKLAADLVNGYIEALRKMLNEKAFTIAKRNRIFIEEQLSQNKMELLGAGKQLNEFYKGGRVSSVESRIDVPVSETNNASYEAAEGMIGELQKQEKVVDNNMLVKDIPQQVYLQYLTLRRGLLTQVNTLLTQQYELAKIDESRNELAFQVVDPARVPTSRCWPKRTSMVVSAFILSAIAACFTVLLMEYFIKLKRTAI